MLKKAFIGFVIILAGLAIYITTLPSDFKVSRSIEIPTTAIEVFSRVNDLHEWEKWSPWAQIDPKAKTSYSGPQAGVGAVFTWAGNHQVGEGKMTIIESKPSELVRIKLDFIKPFTASNTAEFVMKSAGQQTTVTWSMYGRNGFFGKAVGLFLNCDKMLGEEFEKGLVRLKNVATAVP